MKRKVDVKLPYLAKAGKGSYFVEYRCFNPQSDRMERFRVYEGFAKCRSISDVNTHADKIIQKIKLKLLAGWRPWNAEDIYIYRDETEYRHLAAAAGNDRRDSSHIRKYISEYLLFKKSEITPKSYESYVSKTRLFVIWLEKNDHAKRRLGEINNEIVISFFQYLINVRKLDKVTVHKYRQNLHNMFEYFREKKIISMNPVHHTPKAMKKVDNAARPIEDRHMAKYIAFAQEHDPQLLIASFFQLLLLCRPNRELRLMQVQDVDLTRQMAYIRDETAKTRSRVITMPNALIELAEKLELHRYPGTYFIFGRGGKPGPDPVGVNYFNRKFSLIKKALNLPDTYKFYSFKHTGAGKLLESGATLAELMSHLGHTNFESTIHYVRRHFGERSQKILDFKPDFLQGLKI